jgi:hypothetical protein
MSRRACRPLDGGSRFGLERLQGPQRAHELGLRGAAIAQQGLERPGAIAVADQREPDAAVRDRSQTLREQIDLDPLRPLEPPGGARDAPDQDVLQGAVRRQLVDQRRLESANSPMSSSGSTTYFSARRPCFRAFLRRSRLAFGGPRSARLPAILPARFGANTADGDGRARRGAGTGHGGIPCWLRLDGDGGGTKHARPQSNVSLTDYRNIVQAERSHDPDGASQPCALTFRQP